MRATSSSARSPNELRPEKPPIEPAIASTSCASSSPVRVRVPRVMSAAIMLLTPFVRASS